MNNLVCALTASNYLQQKSMHYIHHTLWKECLRHRRAVHRRHVIRASCLQTDVAEPRRWHRQTTHEVTYWWAQCCADDVLSSLLPPPPPLLLLLKHFAVVYENRITYRVLPVFIRISYTALIFYRRWMDSVRKANKRPWRSGGVALVLSSEPLTEPVNVSSH